MPGALKKRKEKKRKKNSNWEKKVPGGGRKHGMIEFLGLKIRKIKAK
jgi:hypothetical protein